MEFASSIAESPFLLFRHFFSVAFYSIWVMFAHPRLRSVDGSDKLVSVRPSINEYPWMVVKSFYCVRSSLFLWFTLLTSPQFYTACVVFLPLMWTEIRWW